jgi:serine/threonine protein phosphatase 1
MPFVTGDKIGIDTGAVYGNMLTAVELPRLRFYHA